jgi:AcrR family transcriptional regulator
MYRALHPVDRGVRFGMSGRHFVCDFCAARATDLRIFNNHSATLRLLFMDTRNDLNEGNAAKPARMRRKDARPGELLKAAIAVFARTGFHSASMDEIGACAGVSKGTVYLYFGTKERLFTEAVRHGTEALLEKTELIAADEQASASSTLQRLVSTWDALAAGQSTGDVLKLLLIEASTMPVVARYTERLFERLHALVQGLVDRGIRNGEFRTCNSPMVARIILATLYSHGVGRCLTELLGGAAEDNLYTHIDLVLHGLANRQEQD